MSYISGNHPFLKRFIGSKDFYRHILIIAVPIMVQNGITNFVSLLDNIMIGQLGTEQMSSIAIVNQILAVFNLCIFGGLAGAGIFTAQYFGKNDMEGVRSTFRYKLWMATIITIIGITVFSLFGKNLVGLFLTESADSGDVAAAMDYAMDYLHIVLVGFAPFMIQQCYSSTLSECGHTSVPMKAGICAIFTNLVLNYLLIYGKLGFPALGVKGAAIATVISKFVEVAVVVVWSHTHTHIVPFFAGIYKTLLVPINLVKRFFVKGSPLLLNEGLWSLGQATLVQCYSVRGLSTVAAINIAGTCSNLCNIVFLAMGNAVSIIVGQLLGAGKMEEAKDTDTKLIAFSVFIAICTGALVLLLAPFFPQLYNTTDDVRKMATYFLIVQGLSMPEIAFMNSSYFTLRSGGKTVITFIFDSVTIWAVSIPIAMVLSRYTSIYAPLIMVGVQLGELIKCFVGFVMVKKGIWLNNIVKPE